MFDGFQKRSVDTNQNLISWFQRSSSEIIKYRLKERKKERERERERESEGIKFLHGCSDSNSSIDSGARFRRFLRAFNWFQLRVFNSSYFCVTVQENHLRYHHRLSGHAHGPAVGRAWLLTSPRSLALARRPTTSHRAASRSSRLFSLTSSHRSH